MTSDDDKTTNNKLKENLLNDVGYLKVPAAVKDRFGTPTRYPNPDYRIGKDDDDSFELIFVFSKKDLEKVKK